MQDCPSLARANTRRALENVASRPRPDVSSATPGARSQRGRSAPPCGLPGKPEAVRGPPDSNLPCREISRYGGREIPARATFGVQLVNKQLTETRHDAEIGQDSR